MSCLFFKLLHWCRHPGSSQSHCWLQQLLVACCSVGLSILPALRCSCLVVGSMLELPPGSRAHPASIVWVCLKMSGEKHHLAWAGRTEPSSTVLKIPPLLLSTDSSGDENLSFRTAFLPTVNWVQVRYPVLSCVLRN